MDRSMLEAYRTRWQAVAAAEKMEQQTMTAAQRWQQLNALLRLATALELSVSTQDKDIEIVRQRWNKLKSAYLQASEA